MSEVHILSRGRGQYTSNVEFDIEIKVRIVVGRYKMFQIVLMDGGNSLVRYLSGPEYIRLYRPVRKHVKLATKGR